jgi:hypothetical protein
MSMATLYEPNYDGLFSPCPGGILIVSSHVKVWKAYLQPQEPASSKVNYEMRDARCPDARSATTIGVLLV